MSLTLIGAGPSSPKKGIVEDGLILRLDAADASSYSGSGTDWNDLSDKQEHATLVNGPSFDSEFKGISFDGTDDHALGGDIIQYLGGAYFSYSADVEITICIWFKRTTYVYNQNKTMFGTEQDSADWGIGGRAVAHYTNALGGNDRVSYSDCRLAGCASYSSDDSAPSFTNVFTACTTSTSENFRRIYINGVKDLDIAASTQWGVVNTPPFRYIIGKMPKYSIYYPGLIYKIYVYDRALTDSEVMQNYNSHKTYFGH